MVNKIDDGSGVLDFEDFVTVILKISAFYFPTFAKADCTIFALSVDRLVGRSVPPLISLLLYNRFEHKKNKDQNSNKRFALFTWSSLFTFPFRFFICFKPEESDKKQGKKGDKEAS